METRSAKRRKQLSDESHEVSAEDRISVLPKEIVHHIFSFLPIECIARTCVLSKFWRYMWYSYPKLDFTSQFALRFVNRGNSEADCVHRVLRLLEKRSDLTSLKFRGGTSVSGLVRLLRVAVVKHNVQELDLTIKTCGGCFHIPPFLVKSLSLRNLRLHSSRYAMRLPQLDVMRNGFRSLETLCIGRLDLLDQPSLLDLFTDSSFPSLKKFIGISLRLKYLRIRMSGLLDFYLGSCFDIQELDISAQKLKKLQVENCFHNSVLGSRVKIDSPLLESIEWSNSVTDECNIGKFDSLTDADVYFSLLHGDLNYSKMRSISDFLTGISQCHRLVLRGDFIEILSRSDPLASGLQWCVFDRLRSLQLSTNRHNNQTLATLFKCSPTVSVLKIWICPKKMELPEDMYNWESQAQALDSFVCHLKKVSIFGVSESQNALGLVEFLLKHGRALQMVFLCNFSHGSKMSTEIKSRIMGFSRASSTAEIVME